MGRRGCVVGEVAFDDCRVPPTTCSACRRGHARDARDVQLRADHPRWVGARRCAKRIRHRESHAQRRDAFGAKLGTKELIWSDIAEMSWRIDAAELLTYRAAKLYDAGTRHATDEAGGDGKARRDGDGDVLRRPNRADSRWRRTHEGIRARRADLSRRTRLPIVGGSRRSPLLIATADLPAISRVFERAPCAPQPSTG